MSGSTAEPGRDRTKTGTSGPRSNPIVIIGAGAAGLSAALRLASSGWPVLVLERAATPGGKMRQVEIAGSRLDAGPTVVTMRWVFEELFDEAGLAFEDYVPLAPVTRIARHAWREGESLDLFADPERSRAAIAAFAGEAEAVRFDTFCARIRSMFETLDPVFIRNTKPTPFSAATRIGLTRLKAMLRAAPHQRLWTALEQHFGDPRLRQLFGRYATYCGASPMLAPATLMLVAHVELEGVWHVDGGVHALAQGLARAAEVKGATIRYGVDVASIETQGGRISGVRLTSGEEITTDTVISGGDIAALSGGHLGPDVQRSVPSVAPRHRSLSAVTWNLLGHPKGLDLAHHTVLFSQDYEAEFAALARGHPPPDPTIYICAQDRLDTDAAADDDAPSNTVPSNTASSAPERLFLLMNAPARGDIAPLSPKEIDQCLSRTKATLARAGLRITHATDHVTTTTPADFNRLYPGTGGALYGRANHGMMGSFRRPGSRSRVPGLYLASGSAHPGAGVPMATLSGRMAADAVMADQPLRVARPTRSSQG
ncbi:MAG: 1-hydroxycarotenoid 3,4-desaturase CrtD [Pseudomonadota bacterium]